MAKTPKRPRDPNQLAKMILDIATGEADENEAAPVTIGSAGGKARAVSISPNRRAEIARKAASARWEKTADAEAQTSESDQD